MSYSALPSRDYVKIEDPAYAAFHLDETSRLFSHLKDNSRIKSISAAKIAENITMLYTKIMMGLADSMTFDLRSGFPIKYEFMQVSVETDIVNEKIKHNYSPEKIRENIISGIDSLPLEDFHEKAEAMIKKNMTSLGKYHYYMKLFKNQSYDNINITAKVIEEKSPSLIKLDMFGFSPALNSFVEHNLEVYDTPRIFRSKKFKKESHDNASVSKDILDKMRILFSRESNILFYEISKKGDLLVRKSERSIFGPLYSPISTPSTVFSGIDPQNKKMNAISRDAASFILSVHTDRSTEYYDPDIESGDEDPDSKKMIMNPFIDISHKYIADENLSQAIAEVVPRYDILTIKGK